MECQGLFGIGGFIIDDKIRDQACSHVHELCICSLWPSKFVPLQCRSRTWRKKKIIGGSCRGKGVILSNCYCQSIGIAGAASPCLSLLIFQCCFIHQPCIKMLTESSPTSTERKREILLIEERRPCGRLHRHRHRLRR